MSKAVFLDRDGVINNDAGHLHDVAGLELFPGTAQAIRLLNEKGYRVVVVSNQAAVAKGVATVGEVEAVNTEIKARLAKDGAVIDAVYYCPHHPQGTIKKYAIACECRKPEIGMIKTAAAELGIDIKKSFLVGDKTSDILAGQRAGLVTIMVKTGYAGDDGLHEVTPDFVADNLVSAVTYIS